MACEDTGCGIPWEEMRWVLDPEGHGEFVQEEEVSGSSQLVPTAVTFQSIQPPLTPPPFFLSSSRPPPFLSLSQRNAYIQPAGADSSASATTHAPTKHTSASTAFSSLLTSLPGRLLRRVMGAGDDSASGNARGGKGFQDAWTPYPVRFLLSASLVSGGMLRAGPKGSAEGDAVDAVPCALLSVCKCGERLGEPHARVHGYGPSRRLFLSILPPTLPLCCPPLSAFPSSQVSLMRGCMGTAIQASVSLNSSSHPPPLLPSSFCFSIVPGEPHARVSLMRGCMGVATQDHVGSTIMVALPMKARHVAPPTGAAVGEDEEGEGEGEEEGEEEEGMEEGMEEAMVWVDMKWATREVVEGKRALVVDGDGVRAEATITALRYLGVQAAVAGTHEEATRKILGRQPEAAWRSGGNPKPRISSSTDVGAQGKPANGSDAAASKSGIGFGRRIKFDHRSLVLFHSASAAARAPVSPPLPASIPLPAGLSHATNSVSPPAGANRAGCAGVSYARALAAGFADTLPQPCLVADLAQCLHAVSPLIARVTSCALSLAVALPIPSPSCASWLTSPSACMRALAGGGFADTLPQLCLVADLAQCLHALFAPIDQSDNLSDTSTNHVAPADPSAVSSLAPSTPPRPKSPQFRSKAALGLVKPEDAAALLKEMLSGREVMVVDDNAVNRMVARKTLQGLGAKVELVGSGEKALERLSLSSPNAFAMLLIDLHMPPGIDGKNSLVQSVDSAGAGGEGGACGEQGEGIGETK
ncbi:unnamed protein product [Closterium sp. NIES-64]|nr:unnamed protein product [Closterium sp. NIES-64]